MAKEAYQFCLSFQRTSVSSTFLLLPFLLFFVSISFNFMIFIILLLTLVLLLFFFSNCFRCKLDCLSESFLFLEDCIAINFPQKPLYLSSVAKRERVEKVFPHQANNHLSLEILQGCSGQSGCSLNCGSQGGEERALVLLILISVMQALLGSVSHAPDLSQSQVGKDSQGARRASGTWCGRLWVLAQRMIKASLCARHSLLSCTH